MKQFRRNIGIILFLGISSAAFAQYDDFDSVEDWTLEDVEEEAPTPQHKEYKNFFYLQYSPSRYHTGDNKVKFNEFTVGYARSIQIMEDMPYFVEVGANLKYSHAKENEAKYNLLTFKIPVNAVYKFYLSKTKDIALAPYAGVYMRALAVAKERQDGGEKYSLLNVDNAEFTAIGEKWSCFQIGWQVGLKFYINKVFMGISYARDFPDKTKFPQVHECSVHIGYCF